MKQRLSAAILIIASFGFGAPAPAQTGDQYNSNGSADTGQTIACGPGVFEGGVSPTYEKPMVCTNNTWTCPDSSSPEDKWFGTAPGNICTYQKPVPCPSGPVGSQPDGGANYGGANAAPNAAPTDGNNQAASTTPPPPSASPVAPVPFQPLIDAQRADLENKLKQLGQCFAVAKASFDTQKRLSVAKQYEDFNDCTSRAPKLSDGDISAADRERCDREVQVKQDQRYNYIVQRENNTLSAFNSEADQIRAMLKNGGYITDASLLTPSTCPSP